MLASFPISTQKPLGPWVLSPCQSGSFGFWAEKTAGFQFYLLLFGAWNQGVFPFLHWTACLLACPLLFLEHWLASRTFRSLSLVCSPRSSNVGPTRCWFGWS